MLLDSEVVESQPDECPVDGASNVEVGGYVPASAGADPSLVVDVSVLVVLQGEEEYVWKLDDELHGL